MITTILARYTIHPCWHTICPTEIPKGTQNIHFFRLREIKCFLRVSSIMCKLDTCFFTNPNIVQSSKYTSINLWMKSLNAAMTTCEKIVAAFFSPKGITIHWKHPHSFTKVVLLLSSSAILIWWYPRNPSINEYASHLPTFSNTLSMNGVGNGSCTQVSFNFLRSTHILISPFCFFSYTTIGLTQSDSSTGSIIPTTSILSNSSQTFSLYFGFKW